MGDDVRAAATSGSLIVPIRGRGGLAIGSLGMAWTHPLEQPEAQLARVTTVAELVGQTPDRLELLAANERVADMARGGADLADARPERPRSKASSRPRSSS